MNWQLLLPLLVTSIITMIGWYMLHHFARKRDFENRKKEIRINYLIEAWRKLEHVANRQKINGEDEKKKVLVAIEQAVADIQLFGTAQQIDLIKRLLTDLKEQHKGSLDELLDDLRQDLRRELDIEKVHGKLTYFRMNY